MSISLVSIHASMKSPSEGGGDESQQTLNISVFYTLMKEVFGLDAQEQGCPVPVARILMEVNQPKNSPPMDIELLAIQRAREEAPYNS